MNTRLFHRFLVLLLAGVVCSSAPSAVAQHPPAAGASSKKPKPPVDKKPAQKKPAAKTKGGPPATTPAPAWHPPTPSAVEPPRPAVIDLAIDKATLDNGLRVVLNPDPTLPTVAIALAYAAGSRQETKNQEGFALTVQRALADSLATLPNRTRVQELLDRGATLTSVATTDEVVFLDLLPAGALEVGLWLEAERMKSGRVTEEGLEKQRTLLREQSQLLPSIARLASVQARLEQLSFEGYWPYEHDSQGGASLPQAPLSALNDFRQAWYAPNQAVLTLSGSFEPAKALGLIHQYFAGVPRNPQSPVLNPPPLPDQTNQRSAVLRKEQLQNPLFAYGWAVPAERQPEHDALAMACALLGDGPDSRLAQRFAKAKLPVSFTIEIDQRRGPSLLLLAVQGGTEAHLVSARKIVDDEIDSLARLGPTTEEIRRLWRTEQSNFLLGLSKIDQRALRLSRLELLHGDARLVHAELGRLLSLGKDDIRKAVGRFLSPTRRSLVEANAQGHAVEPVPKPAPVAIPAPPQGPPGASTKPAGKKKPAPKKKKK